MWFNRPGHRRPLINCSVQMLKGSLRFHQWTGAMTKSSVYRLSFCRPLLIGIIFDGDREHDQTCKVQSGYEWLLSFSYSPSISLHFSCHVNIIQFLSTQSFEMKSMNMWPIVHKALFLFSCASVCLLSQMLVLLALPYLVSLSVKHSKHYISQIKLILQWWILIT